MLDLREIGLRDDTPFVRNLRARFEPLDSSLQCGAIDHPPNEDDKRRNEGGK